MSRPVLLLGLAQLGLLAALGWLPGARMTPFPALGLWGAIFLLYLAAATAHSFRPASAATVWGTALAMRAVLLPLPPWFSDDIWRYLWDGHVQLRGVNPYLYAPADAELEPLRTAWHALINHPEVPTIYPPGAQLAFLALGALGALATAGAAGAAAATAAAGPLALFKGAWVAADLSVGLLLQRLTRSPGSGVSPAALLWLWSPLVIVEVAWSGHVEPLGLLPVLAAVALGRRARGLGPSPGPFQPENPDRRHGPRRLGPKALAAGALVGIGAAIKLAPLAALPAVWRRLGPAAGAAALAVPLLLALPYLSAGSAMLEGLRTYAERWEFNAGAFRMLRLALGEDGGRMLAAGTVAALAVTAGLRGWSLERALLWTVGAALLLSPTLHPWYALWVLPFALLRRSPAWVLLSGLVFLSYAGHDAFLATGDWPQPAWLSLLVHGPVLLLLGLERLAPHRLPGRRQIAGGEEPREGNRRQ